MTHAEELSRTAGRRLSLEFAAVACNLAIAVPLAYVLNLWQDEAYTLHTTAAGVSYAFRAAIGFEQNAPLYFVVVALLRHAGDGIFFLRLFSVLCIAATVALVPALSRRYLPATNASLVTAAVAVNPFVIWAAVDMRAYALIVLISGLLLLAFHEAFVAERPSRFAAAGYALCVAAALYTQYYLAFLVAGQAVALFLCHRRRMLPFLVAAAAGAAAFAPMLAIVPGQVENFKDGFASPTLIGSVATLGGIVLRYVLPLPLTHVKLADALVVTAVALAFFVFRPRLRPDGGVLIVLMTGCAALCFAAGTYLGGVHILDRHAASLYLAAILSVFASIAWLPAPVAVRTARAWSVVVVALSLLTLVHTYAGLANAGDWARVAAYLQNNEGPREPIVVFEAENALPLAYYYRGRNRVVPVPKAVDFHHYDVTAFVIRDSAQLELAMPAERRVWLVTAGACSAANLQFGCETLEKFVRQRYSIVSDTSFHGSRVRLLLKKPQDGPFGKNTPAVERRSGGMPQARRFSKPSG